MKNEKIFWVTTPCNRENWLILSSNKREAESFHELSEGFNEGYSKATFICKIPKSIELDDKENWAQIDLLEKLNFKIIEPEFPRIVSYEGTVFGEGKSHLSIIENQASKKSGLYVIQINNENKFKIGFTKNLESRLQSFRTASPYIIKLIYYVETIHYKSLERKIHKEMKNLRKKGEWFELSNNDLSELREIFVDLDSESDDFKFIDVLGITNYIEHKITE